jgi:multidrug efflux pump subunit AcrB
VSPTPDQPISRDEIEAKMREITGEVSGEVESARNIAMAAGIAVVVVVVVVAFFLGRRRGHRRTTIVEVRRI